MQAIIGALRVVLGMDSAAFERGANEAERRMARMRRQFDRMGQRIQTAGSRMAVGITAPVVGAFTGIIRSAANFEQSMNRVQALTGATEGQFKALQETAQELGATTKFSASQAADAMGFLAMAGFDAEQIIGAMPSTLQLAAAANADLATSADIVSNILSGFGLEVEELSTVNDVLVKALSSSNTDIRQLGDALKYVGPVASSAGLDFNEVVAAIGLLGNAGIQGEMGGTALRGMLSRLLAPTSAVSDTIEELGLNLYEADGSLRGLAEIMEELEPHAQNTGALMTLFGQRAGPGMAALLSQGVDELRAFERELDGSSGVAADIAAQQMRGFNGAVLELKSALEGLAIAIGNSGLLEFLTRMAQRVTAWVRSMSEASPEMFRFGVVAAALAAVVGPVLIALGGLVAVAAPLAGIIAAIVSPIGLVAASVATLGVAIYNNWDSIAERFPAIAALVERAVGAMADHFSRVSDTLAIVWQSIKDGVTGLLEVVEGALTGDWKRAWEGGDTIVQAALDAILAVINLAFGGLLERFADYGKDGIEGLRSGFANGVKFIAAAAADLWTAISDEVSSWPGRLAEWGRQMIQGLIEGIREMIPGLRSEMRGLPTFEPGNLPSGPTIPLSGGAAQGVGDGLVEGLESYLGEANRAGAGLAGAVEDGFRDQAEIRSPSRLFQRLGQMLIDGLGIGIRGGVAGPVDQMRQSAAAMAEAMRAGTFDPAAESAERMGDRLEAVADRTRRAFENIGGTLGGLLTGRQTVRGLAGGAFSSVGSSLTRSGLQGISDNIGGPFGGFAAGLIGSLLPFRNGGSFEVGGVGGIDSQLVAFRATPGEMVNVSRPGLAGQAQRAGGSGVARIVIETDHGVIAQIAENTTGQMIEVNNRQRAAEFPGRVNAVRQSVHRRER